MTDTTMTETHRIFSYYAKPKPEPTEPIIVSDAEMIEYLFETVSPFSTFFGFIVDMQRQESQGRLTDKQRQALWRSYRQTNAGTSFYATALSRPSNQGDQSRKKLSGPFAGAHRAF
jgi:hypothetical protein